MYTVWYSVCCWPLFKRTSHLLPLLCGNVLSFVLSCDLLGYLGPEIYLAGKHSSQALPPALMGGIKYPSTWARNTSSPPMYYSGGAEGISGGGSCGKYSPTPIGGSAGLSLHLNPTTLAMLQQHNYIPYFRGTSD